MDDGRHQQNARRDVVEETRRHALMIQDLGSPTQEARWRHHARVALSSDAGIRPRQTIPPLTNPAGASSTLFFLARVQPRRCVPTRGLLCLPHGPDRCHETASESTCTSYPSIADAACAPRALRPSRRFLSQKRPRDSRPRGRPNGRLNRGGNPALNRNRIV